MSEHDRFSEDCGAYVLGALEEHEAEALRAHMATCVSCRDEVARLDAVAEVLGLGVPALSAPAELRTRVLDVVRREAALFAAAEAPLKPARAARRWRLTPLAGVLGGVALAAGVAFGAVVIAPGSGGNPTTKVISASVAGPARWGGRTPTATLRRTGGSGELMLSDLPAAPSGKIYEIWIVRGGRPQPTTVLFDATSSGSADVGVSGLGGASAVLVTAERIGGARTPTMSPLIRAQLS
jgi:anti-sigma factor RsiW